MIDLQDALSSGSAASNLMASHKENHYDGLPDIRMNTAKGMTVGTPDIHMATAKGLTMEHDVRMETARAGTTLKEGGFQLWERELLESPEVRRKSTVAQLCEYLLAWSKDHFPAGNNAFQASKTMTLTAHYLI